MIFSHVLYQLSYPATWRRGHEASGVSRLPDADAGRVRHGLDK
jgi:hypothetical protein